MVISREKSNQFNDRKSEAAGIFLLVGQVNVIEKRDIALLINRFAEAVAFDLIACEWSWREQP